MSSHSEFHVKHRRPLLCRLGLHHWGPWDIRPGNWRIVEKHCRCCHVRRIMIDKRPALGSGELAIGALTTEKGRQE